MARTGTLRAILLALLVAAIPPGASSTLLTASLHKIGTMYTTVLTRAPMAAHCVQGAAVTAIGDAASQYIERDYGPKMKLKKKTGKGVKEKGMALSETWLNGGRLFRASAIGLIVNGLVVPPYYNAIQAFIPGRDPASVVKKVCIDAVTWGVGMNFALITLRLAMEGTPWGEAVRIAKAEIPEVARSDLCTWGGYNALCYGAIPKAIQPMTTAMMSALWGTYMSFVSVGKHPQQPS